MILQRMMVCVVVLASYSVANADLAHRYSFNDNVEDSISGAHGTLVDPNGVASFDGGRLDFSNNTGGSNDNPIPGAYVDLPNGIISAAAGVSGQLTVEIWSQSFDNGNWRALFSAGTSNGGEGSSSGGQDADYIQLIPRAGNDGNTLRATTHAAGNNDEGFVNYSSEMSTSENTHLVAVFDQSGGLPGTVTMYVNGSLVGDNAIATGLDLSAMDDNNNWLGRSQWPDGLFRGWYDELRIYSSALDAQAVATNFQLGPNTVIPEPTSLVLLVMAGGALGAVRRDRR